MSRQYSAFRAHLPESRLDGGKEATVRDAGAPIIYVDEGSRVPPKTSSY
jgi:hypothetical protein